MVTSMLAGVSKHYACVNNLIIGSVGNGNFRPPFFIKCNISAMDRLVVVKFHVVKFHANIANRWLHDTKKNNGYHSLFIKLFLT